MVKMVLMVKTDNRGQAGADGISPTIAETQTASGYDITITDKNGSKTISLVNGKDGKDGAKGEKRRPWTKRRTRQSWKRWN